MKGKKCIGLLILCITCLLSLNLFSNANAYELITAEYVKSFSFTTYGSSPYNGTQYSYNLDSTFTSPFITFDVPADGKVGLNILKITLRNQKEFKQNEKFKFDIVFYDYSTATNNLSFSFPACPKGSNNFIITSCTYEVLDSSNPIQFPTTFPSTTTQNSSIYYTVLHIEGTRRYTDLTTDVISLTTDSFYNIKNFSNAINQTHYIGMHFSTIDIYKDDTAEDEAAEKELEDRDNLESQSTSTDSEANNAGQSAENTGTTLFAAFTQFFNALTNVSGSSCVLPRMQVYSLDLGQMDLCTYDIPPQIMALVSIGMVFIIVPLGIHLVKRMINLYKEITG
jgi:hypothetical protein